MDKMLTVKYGSIYDKHGDMIDNMAIIFNKDFGLYKYGELKNIEEYYNNLTYKLKSKGLQDLLEDYSFISFDRYKKTFTIEEICSFVNFMIMTSANADKISEMLYMSIGDLKKEIFKLVKFGY